MTRAKRPPVNKTWKLNVIARCTGCLHVWEANSNWPMGVAARHSQVTGHSVIVESHLEATYRQGEHKEVNRGATPAS